MLLSFSAFLASNVQSNNVFFVFPQFFTAGSDIDIEEVEEMAEHQDDFDDSHDEDDNSEGEYDYSTISSRGGYRTVEAKGQARVIYSSPVEDHQSRSQAVRAKRKNSAPVSDESSQSSREKGARKQRSGNNAGSNAKKSRGTTKKNSNKRQKQSHGQEESDDETGRSEGDLQQIRNNKNKQRRNMDQVLVQESVSTSAKRKIEQLTNDNKKWKAALRNANAQLEAAQCDLKIERAKVKEQCITIKALESRGGGSCSVNMKSSLKKVLEDALKKVWRQWKILTNNEAIEKVPTERCQDNGFGQIL